MIRSMTPYDRDFYLFAASEFYNSDAVIKPVPKEYLVNIFDELITSDRYLLGYILAAEGENAGFAVLSKQFATESGGLCIWIEDLYVLPEFRSKGLGSEFFSYIDKTLRNEAGRFRIEVEHNNERAKAFYKRIGFTEHGYEQFVQDLSEK